MNQVPIRTARLELVPLADEHLELEVELDSDPEVMRYLTGRALSRAEVERAHQRRLAAARPVPGLGFWVGFADAAFVGWWILQPPHGPDQPKVAGAADLGFRLLRRQWRRGYASEGARALVRYGFTDVGLNRIIGQTMAVNTASRATLTAAGLSFVRAFTSTEPYDDLIDGADQGEVEYEITRASWAQAAKRGTPQRVPTVSGFVTRDRAMEPSNVLGIHRALRTPACCILVVSNFLISGRGRGVSTGKCSEPPVWA